MRAAASMGDQSAPLARVVRILNNHLQALTQIDGRIDDVSAKLSALPAPSADGA
jgi:hypothetical protein